MIPVSSSWYSAATLSAIAPPIEQPMTTGRLSPSVSHTARIISRYDAVVSRYFFNHQPSGGVERP